MQQQPQYAAMKWAWAALAVGTALVGGMRSCRAQMAPPHYTFIFDSLTVALDSIADTASIEHFRCLLGVRVSNDTLAVFDALEPPIQYADYNTVNATCPESEYVVGYWHNHIPYAVPMNDPHNRATKVEPWSVCEASPPDKRMLLAAPPHVWISMISVANGVHCAWVRLSATDTKRLPWFVR